MCNSQTNSHVPVHYTNYIILFHFFFWKKNRNYLEFVCVVSFLIVFKFFLHFIFGISIRLFGRLNRSISNRITSMQIVSFHCRLSIFFFKTETEREKAQAPVWYDMIYIYRYIYLYVCKSKCKINWQTFWTRAVTRSTLDMLW